MTAPQRRVLVRLEQIGRDGWPVTVREVAAAVGIGPSTAHVHLVALEQQGHARRHPRSPKGGWKAWPSR